MIKRIDWHSHILPQMDDGSASVEESLDMLKVLASSGVEAVALTPHFYPDRSYPEIFLRDREESYKKMQTVFFEGMPKLFLGAEVAYFDGIRTCDDMRNLVIDQTNCLLIEMPMRAWNERMFENILRLAKRIEITPVLAHIDRYFLRKNDWKLIAHYLDEGGLVQGNADFFVTPKTKEEVKAVISLCKEENVPYYILGNGSNLLVGDKGYRGVIIQIYKEMNAIEINGEEIKEEKVCEI